MLVMQSILGMAFAQNGSEISITTNKSEYDVNETIVVSGIVEGVKPGDKPLLRVFFPSGELYRIDPVDIDTDGRYTYELRIGGPMATVGTYELVMNYGQKEAHASILVTTGTVMTCENYFFHPNESSKRPLTVGNNTYRISHLTIGAALTGLTIDADRKSLVANISSTSDGCMIIELPKDIIEAENRDFTVNVDRQQGMFREIEDNRNDTRTLHIDFENGADNIEIIGTRVIPEFPLPLVAVTAAVIGAIIFRQLGRIR
jgi:hypothetical protein